LDQLNNGQSLDVTEDLIANEEDLERYRNNIQQLIDIVLSRAMNIGKIDEKDIVSIIERINQETKTKLDVDFDRDSLDLTERQQREIELARQTEQRRQQQAEREQQRRRELAEKNQSLLDRLEQQRKEQEEQNQRAAEERRKQTEQRYLET